MGGGGGGRLFEAERFLTFSAFRMGAYSRWALIRGWALIRINTVTYNFIFSGVGWSYFLLAGADYPDPGNRLLLLAITQSHFPLNTQASHVDVLRLSFGPLQVLTAH